MTHSTTTGSAHIDISTIENGSYVDGVYCLMNPQLGTTRGGKTYLKCILRDASGEVPGRKWTFSKTEFPDVTSTGFAWISGTGQLYKEQVQIIIEQIRPVEVGAEEIRSLLPATRRDIEEMYGEVCRLLESLTHPGIRALSRAYLEDEALMNRFKMAPAAMQIHHAWIGGLLEHTLQLMTIADAILPLYPQVNRDLVIFGLFLHDLGKTSELQWERGFEYTTDGHLIGHIVRGAIWLQVKAAVAQRDGAGLPPAALRALQHIIISHHGEPAFGAAKRPSTPEAVLVSMLDNLDAKTQIALTASARDDEKVSAEFTDKIWSLETRMYRPDPLAEGHNGREQEGSAEGMDDADDPADPASIPTETAPGTPDLFGGTQGDDDGDGEGATTGEHPASNAPPA